MHECDWRDHDVRRHRQHRVHCDAEWAAGFVVFLVLVLVLGGKVLARGLPRGELAWVVVSDLGCACPEEEQQTYERGDAEAYALAGMREVFHETG